MLSLPANTIFWPLLAHVALVLGLLLRLKSVKVKAIADGNVDRAATALNNDAWPDEVRKVTNNVRNQFEVPTMFYALTFMLWALGAVDVVSVGAASLFIVSRYVHAYIHTGSNHVPTRLLAYSVGVGLVAVMALRAAVCLAGIA